MSASVPAVLSLGATTKITDPGQIIGFVLRQFATTPRSLSTIYYDQVISLVDIISKSGNESQAVTIPSQEALSSVLDRIFGIGASSVTAEAEQLNDASYNLVLSVQVTANGQLYGMSSTVLINNGLPVLENDTVPMPS